MIEEPTKEVSAQTVLAEVVGKLLAQGVQTGDTVFVVKPPIRRQGIMSGRPA